MKREQFWDIIKTGFNYHSPHKRRLLVKYIPGLATLIYYTKLLWLIFTSSIVARYGTSAYAAYGIGISLVSFSIVIGFGFGIAAATLVGQQLGAGNRELAVKSGWRGLRMALAAMIVLSILLSSTPACDSV